MAGAQWGDGRTPGGFGSGRAIGEPPLIHTGLLEVLLRATEPMTRDRIAARLGWAPARVASELHRLRHAGCELEEHPQRGVRLLRAGVATWKDYLEVHSGSRTVEVYARTASTQDAARRIAERARAPAAADGALAIADEQTAGRGRLGRRWIAPAGTAVTFSLVHAPDRDRGVAVDRLMLATAVAVAQAIETVAARRGVEARIKWPNDVLVDGRKIAGVLVETFAPAGGGAAAIIGVGINVALRPEQLPSDEAGLRERVTSLAMLGADVDRLLVLDEAVRRMDGALHAAPTETLADEWRRRSALAGQRVRLRSDGREFAGHVVEIDPAGGLVLRTQTGELVYLPAATTTVL